MWASTRTGSLAHATPICVLRIWLLRVKQATMANKGQLGLP